MLAACGLVTSAYAQQAAANPAPNAAAAPADTVRPELFNILDPNAIKPLIDSKNFTEVQNRITQAEGFQNLSPYETYVINRMKLSLGAASGNNAMTTKALEDVIASGRLKPAEMSDYYLSLANTYYRNKDYPKTLEVLKRYQAQGGSADRVRPMLVNVHYASGDFATAKAEVQPIIAAAEQAGKAPDEADLRMLAVTANKTRDDVSYVSALEKLVTHYPNDDIWTDLLSRVQRKPGYDMQNNTINLLRLEVAAVKKPDAGHYIDLADLALSAGFPTEAKKALDAGFDAGVLGSGANATKQRQLRDKAAKGATDDARNIASGEASAAKSKTGAGLVNLGWAYVTMDQFDKGIGFIEQGIAKGGLKQPDEAKLRLGMAYARAGRKPEAIRTFQTVKAGGGLSDLAKYWVVLLNRPPAGTATTAPK
jgi:hypothetical protein